jgi:hypothetical protein
MKTKVLIISFLIVALLGAFTLKVNAQYSNRINNVVTIKQDTVISNDELLADETTLNYTKTEAKIICDNEKVFNELFKSHGTLFKRFTCTWKSDRYGRYKHYVVYLAKGDAELIKSWSNINL